MNKKGFLQYFQRFLSKPLVSSAPLPPAVIIHAYLTASSQLLRFISLITAKKLFWHSVPSVKNKTCNCSIHLLPLWYAAKRPIFTIEHALTVSTTTKLNHLVCDYWKTNHIKITVTIKVTVLTVHTMYGSTITSAHLTVHYQVKQIWPLKHTSFGFVF